MLLGYYVIKMKSNKFPILAILVHSAIIIINYDGNLRSNLDWKFLWSDWRKHENFSNLMHIFLVATFSETGINVIILRCTLRVVLHSSSTALYKDASHFPIAFFHSNIIWIPDNVPIDSAWWTETISNCSLNCVMATLFITNLHI